MRILTLLIIAILSGCSVKDIPLRDSLPEKQVERWWEIYENKELTSLIQTALNDNWKIRSLRYRLKQSLALKLEALSKLSPNLEARASKGVEKSEGEPSYRSESLRFSLYYDLDIFKKNRNRVDSATFASYETATQNQAVKIELSVDLANSYHSYCAEREKLTLLNKKLTLLKKRAEIIRHRLLSNEKSLPELLQAKSKIESVEYEIKKSRLLAQTYERSILYLISKEKKAPSLECTESRTPKKLPEISIEDLKNRPDLEAFFYRVKKYESDYEFSTKLRLPSIEISALLSYDALSLSNLLKEWFLSLSASASSTLYDGGGIKAQRDLSYNKTMEALYLYRDALLKALNDAVESKKRVDYQQKRVAYIESKIVNDEKRAQSGYEYMLSLEKTPIEFVDYEIELLEDRIDLLETKKLLMEYIADYYLKTTAGWERIEK